MDKKEITALRRPFVKELFQKNMFNLVMTVLAAFLVAASNLVISWTIKAISDLISGDTATSYGTLLLVASVGFVMMLAAWLLDRTFLSKFRAKAMQQYRKYVFDRLLEKGIQAFSGENSARYLSALSNDANTIEQDYVRMLQNTIQVGITFVGALGMMLWYSPLLTLIAIGFSLLPIIVSVVLGNKAAVAEKNVSDRKERYTGMLKDVLSGFAVIKSSRRRRAFPPFTTKATTALLTRQKTGRRSSSTSPMPPASRAAYCSSACSLWLQPWHFPAKAASPPARQSSSYSF